MKVKKITPVMNAINSICNKCKFGGDDFCNADTLCRDCELYDGRHCVCTTVNIGQPCPYFKRKTKVKKITPIKREKTLCRKCKFGYTRHCLLKHCGECEMGSGRVCKCTTIKEGQPCPYFERYEEEAQK